MDIDIKLKKTKKSLLIIAGILVLYWLVTYIINYETSKVPLPTVVIKNPHFATVVEYVTQTGTLVSYKTVDLVARVEGFLEKQNFKDGTFVHKGQELFLIEQQTYLEKLKAAQADVRAKKASLNYTIIEHERQKKMFAQNATSLNNVQSWSAKRDEAEAALDKSIADEHIAAINYSYSKVLAPFTGRIGRHLVNVGNLVGHNEATKLATIEVIDPIYLYFNLNEIDLIKIRDIVKKENINPDKVDTIPIEIKTQNQTKFTYKGNLNFVNTGLDPSTGTLEMRALLTNKQLDLLPGLFVEIRIPVTPATKRIFIPESCVLFNQIGAYVLVTDKNNYVQIRRVKLGSENNGYRVILAGLTSKDNLIVSGVYNATPGRQVLPIDSIKQIASAQGLPHGAYESLSKSSKRAKQ